MGFYKMTAKACRVGAGRDVEVTIYLEAPDIVTALDVYKRMPSARRENGYLPYVTRNMNEGEIDILRCWAKRNGKIWRLAERPLIYYGSCPPV
jgi:hypothetical protein